MKKTIFVIIFSTVVLGITTGIIVHFFKDKKLEQSTVESIKEINRNLENQIVVKTVALDEKTTPNTKVTFETNYSRCGHNTIEKKKIDSEDVNKTQDEIEKKYSDWKIQKFSEDEVYFYKEINSMCDEHYLIKENNGFIEVYSVNDMGKQELKEKTDIAVQYLPEKDVQLLKQGIKANSNLELEQIISDYE
ncbi:MAG: BofC C-terminal domain-containing protein [Clostridia bacterium]|nr:BofC C-terminal domain-containing protein [Clostridia bacterium]